jgi:hypothetical protein
MTFSYYHPITLIGTLALLLTLLLSVFPSSAQALSCLAPSESIKNYVDNPEYIILDAVAGELETWGSMHNQDITVTRIYQGTATEKMTVGFGYNKTWQYSCVGQPPATGSEALYVVRNGQVQQVFSMDSELRDEVLTELATEGTEPQPTPKEESEPETNIAPPSFLQRILTFLQRLFTF